MKETVEEQKTTTERVFVERQYQVRNDIQLEEANFLSPFFFLFTSI